MATLLLSAVGAAAGAGFGGTVLGLSGAVIGRAVGATLGRVIDQRLLGAGSDAVEVGRVDRFRLMGASEGAAVPQVFGRVRLAGQVIWATRFEETTATSGGGKGAPKAPKTTEYSYSVSLAIALCEGGITNIGRIWADGVEISPRDLNLRLYLGGEAQTPDPKIEAVEGVGMAPAYREIAYVVLEDLALAQFGNRVPQFSFEVVRYAQGRLANAISDLSGTVRAVAMIPGTGEYSLATTQVHYSEEEGVSRSANVNTPNGVTDFSASVRQLRNELPNVGSVSMVVSWFGSDSRCGTCLVQPKVEQADTEGEGMAWTAGGISRAQAGLVPRVEGRSVYGGTPSDASVVEAISDLKARGREVMFYPFILMEQLAGNTLPDPYSDATGQAVLPWRGRITLSKAPGQAGSPDRTATAAAQVAQFFGNAQPTDFSVSGTTVNYSGPAEWRYRRFILHYAHLCAAAGGVTTFCIGSEMVGLMQIRGAGDTFPAVVAMRTLLAEVRAILGPLVKLTYAADWSEYFGYHTGNDLYFHLDPLWADPECDLIGIDNYMPLADWRDGEDHADAGWGSIYNLDYLKANVAGGEGYDWYYDSPEGEAAQRRKPIEDGAYDEPWVFRYKDIKSWWSNLHFNRANGVRAALPTGWVPGSKPIWFTEYGCAAIDKGANQPNKFLDPKSSESLLPKYSNGRRDDLMQMQYIRAMSEYWESGTTNPLSPLYGGRMVNLMHAHLWAWDARPFPYFPSNREIWSDGDNYARGHWLNGRATNQTLAAVVAEICERSGVTDIDVSGLYGVVRGFWQDSIGSARGALQPLMLVYGFDAIERDGVLVFRMRDGRSTGALEQGEFADVSDIDGALETGRSAEAETAGRVRLGFTEAEGDYESRQVEAIFPDEESLGVSQSDVPLVLTVAEGRGIVERWLAESRVARDRARFALPPSRLVFGAGDVVTIDDARYRIDRVEQTDAQLIEAVRIETGIYRPSDTADERVLLRPFVAPVPTMPLFLDLPLLTGDEVPHAPHLAISARPWPGSVGLWDALEDAGYTFNRSYNAPATAGRSQSVLTAARTGLYDRGTPLRVRLINGTFASVSEKALLNGANTVAIGDGSSDRWEVFQFQTATLVAPRTWDLSMRLRGQLGSDALMPVEWPIGSRVVLIDDAVQQFTLAASTRGISRNYRVGVTSRGYDDPAAVHREEAFQGIGLRPYRPVHLRADRLANDNFAISWIRRTRIDGDGWDTPEVPLGEASERYMLRIYRNGATRREVTLSNDAFTYTTAMQAADGVTAAFRAEVAQISERFGPGPFAGLDLTV